MGGHYRRRPPRESPNLICALQAASEKQMLTVAFAAKDGSRFPELTDHCLIVPFYSIHRIQEAHATVNATEPARAMPESANLY